MREGEAAKKIGGVLRTLNVDTCGDIHMKKDEKEFNPSRACFHLKKLFDAAMGGMDRASRPIRKDRKFLPNETYRLEQDFAYLLDEIQRGPLFSAKKAINDANAMIESLGNGAAK